MANNAEEFEELTDEIIAAFDEVIGPSIPGGANSVIARLDQTKESAAYFTDMAKRNLLALSMEDSGEITIFESQRRRRRNQVEVNKHAGKGTFGTVFRNLIGDNVYKKIEFPDTDPLELEERCRGVFLESFIQTVLSSDSEFGTNVPKIIGMYRETPDKVVEGKVTLYIKMERLSVGWDAVLPKLMGRGGRPITWATIKPMLETLGTSLEQFTKKYNFHHRDLHTGNVMFTDDNRIKLIDFGLSCLQLGDVVYSIKEEAVVAQEIEVPAGRQERGEDVENSPCESNDLLLFVSSLLEFDTDKFAPTAVTQLNRLVTTQSGVNLFKYWEEANEDPERAIFWNMYPTAVSEWNGTLVGPAKVKGRPTTKILTPDDTPVSSPTDFVAALAAAPAAGGSRRTRKRSTKRRAATRRRHY